MLADRLRKLESAGIVERRQYSEHPPRSEYHLTKAGRDLFPVLLALREWGDKWAVDQPAVEFLHDCGQPLRVDLTCQHCGGPVTRDRLVAVPPNGRDDDLLILTGPQAFWVSAASCRSSRSTARSRISPLRTLPVTVIGNPSTMWT